MLNGVRPDVLVPDNALAFVKSKRFISFCSRLGVELEPPPAYSPEGNSAIESKWRVWANEAKTANNRNWDLTVFSHCFSQNNKKSKRYAMATAVEIETGKGVADVRALRERVRASRRLIDAKEKVNAPRFNVGDAVDLWVPKRSKMEVGWRSAKVVEVRHPTYQVEDDNGRSYEVSVRRLKKKPDDPFVKLSIGDDSVSGDSSQESVAEEDEEEERSSQVAIEDLEVGDFILYSEGGSIFGGRLTNVYNEAVEFHEAVFKRKAKRIKAVATWVDGDGTVVTTNYKPKNGDRILYKIDRSAVVKKIVLDQGSLLPIGADDNLRLVIT
jgi:hypothetical protein